MEEIIKISFYNHGLRSFIEVDLCRKCPRQDDKGCCGFYSPVFYPADFVYWLENQPAIIDFLFSLPHLTILDSSVTINSPPEGDSYRCAMHSREKGCLFPQQLRESVCRHFVCPGIAWQDDSRLQHWRDFFEQLSVYEIGLNNTISGHLQQENLSLRIPEQRPAYFMRVRELFHALTEPQPAFFSACPPYEAFWLNRPLTYGKDWRL